MALDRHIDADGRRSPDRTGGRRKITLKVRPGKPIKSVGRFYSRFVGVAKVILPLAAICLMALIAAWPTLNDQEQPMVEELEKQPELLQVTAPVLVGTDQENRPYSIVADRANQGAEGPHIVELSRPEGEIATRDGSRISLNADLGRFDRDSKQLHLMGDVRLSRDDGNRFATGEAFVDMDSRSAWGNQPVTGEGPDGEIQSEGFRIEDNGATVIFTGQSRVVLRGGNVQANSEADSVPSAQEGVPAVGASDDEN